MALDIINGKAAVLSTGLIGSTVTILSAITAVLQDQNVIALVPPHYIHYLVVVSGVTAWLGRYFAKKQITTILPKPPTSENDKLGA